MSVLLVPVVLQSVSAVTSAPSATGLSVLPRAPLMRLVRRRRLSCLLSHARRRVYRPTVAIRVFRRLLIVLPTCSTRWTCCRRSRSRSPLRGRVRRPTVLTTQRRRRYSRHQKFPPRSRRALLASPMPHRSSDVLDSLSLLFSLAPTGACPPTNRPNDATAASLPAPSEVSSSFQTCLTRLTHASTVPALAHPQVGVSTVHFAELQAAFLSHRATYGATATNTSSISSITPSPPSVRIFALFPAL